MGGAACGAVASAEELAQQRHVGLEVGRQLKQEQPQLAGLAPASEASRKSATCCSQSRSRLKWVMRCGALNEKRNRSPAPHLPQPDRQPVPRSAACETCSSPRTYSAASSSGSGSPSSAQSPGRIPASTSGKPTRRSRQTGAKVRKRGRFGLVQKEGATNQLRSRLLRAARYNAYPKPATPARQFKRKRKHQHRMTRHKHQLPKSFES